MNQLTVKGNLTPSFINTKLSPFLDSLAGMQRTINEIKHATQSAVTINQISLEGPAEEYTDWEQESYKSTSWEDVQRSLMMLREVIQGLNEQPQDFSVQNTRSRLADLYLNLFRTVINMELERESKTIIDTMHFASNRLLSDVDPFRNAIVLLDSSEIVLNRRAKLDQDEEIQRIIGLLKKKGEE